MANKTRLGESKTIIEIDTEEAFAQLYQRKFGQEKLIDKLWAFFRGKLGTKLPLDLIKGARIVAFIKEDDGALIKAYGAFLLKASAASASAAETVRKGQIRDATDDEQDGSPRANGPRESGAEYPR